MISEKIQKMNTTSSINLSDNDGLSFPLQHFVILSMKMSMSGSMSKAHQHTPMANNPKS